MLAADDDSLDYVMCSQRANNDGCVDNDDSGKSDGIVRTDNHSLNYQPAARIPLERDPIHRLLRVHPDCHRIIHTRQFARLRKLCQLGVARCVFRSAEHTRLPHSLGVSYLGWRLLEGLLDRQPELRAIVTERDVRNVALAGLCHDLGHGPLSHVFEKEFLRRNGITDWKHEAMSIKMLRYLREDNDLQGLIAEEDLEVIRGFIEGAHPDARTRLPAGKRFLYDIVSNDYNGIDVDRMDYLQRDAHYCGHSPLACDLEPLIDSARVVEDQICYPLSQVDNVWAVFRERVRLFQQVYTHWQTKSLEFMAVDVMTLGNKARKFLEHVDINRAEDFVYLDDSLLGDFENWDVLNRPAFEQLPPEEKESFRQAQAILRRMHRGDVYPCCALCEVPERLLLDGSWERDASKFFTAAELVACCSPHGDSTRLAVDDVILDENKIDYKKGGGDPMTSVGFFDEEGCRDVRLHADEQLLEQLTGRPSCFKVRTLRVFTRRAEHRDAAAAAFRSWCLKRLGPEAVVEQPTVGEPGAQQPTQTFLPRAVLCRPAAADIRSTTPPANLPFLPPPSPSASLPLIATVSEAAAFAATAPEVVPTPATKAELYQGRKRRAPVEDGLDGTDMQPRA